LFHVLCYSGEAIKEEQHECVRFLFFNMFHSKHGMRAQSVTLVLDHDVQS